MAEPAQQYSLQSILQNAYGGQQAQPTSALSRQYGPDTVRPSGTAMVTDSLETMLDPNSAYIQNARQRGIEHAATRGGVNSSIAAGAAERAAIEAAAPMASAAVQLEASRENRAFEEFMADRNLNNEFQQTLAASTISNSYNLLNTLQQYALNDPTVFTPEVISGYSNFFGQNTQNIINKLLGKGG